jgi:hypothetical protein
MTSSKRNLILSGVVTAAAIAIATPLLPSPSVATTPTTTPTELTATLSGANEVPPADPNGEGMAFVFGAPSSPDKLCYVVFVNRIGTPIAAHIHRGPAGVVGPVKVPFKTPADGDSAGCVKTTLATRILNNPSNWYVNVHTNAFPNGAIRGQLG